jgi:hypothetical protein
MPNMACTMVGDLGIAVHSAEAPTDAEWHVLLEMMRHADLNRFRGLTFTDGGAPNTAQRRRLTALVGGRPLHAAVVTGSPVVRGVVTALRWSIPEMKTFPPDRLFEALAYLRVSPTELKAVKATVRHLRAELGVDSLQSTGALT